MKKKAKQSQKSKSGVKVTDLKPGRNPRGGHRSKVADKQADKVDAYIRS